MTTRDLWICPQCGRQFTNRNQSHSCARYTVEEGPPGKHEPTSGFTILHAFRHPGQ